MTKLTDIAKKLNLDVSVISRAFSLPLLLNITTYFRQCGMEHQYGKIKINC